MAYECTLTEASLKKAKEELNEDPRDRLGAVQALREWIEREPWINCPTDTVYLLSFLRARKFSQLEARTLLEKYWTFRDKVPKWSKEKEPDDEKILGMIKLGALVPLPGTDEDGRRSVIAKFGVVDPTGKDGTFEDLMQGAFTIIDTLLLDENTQVNGVELIADFSGFSLQHLTSYIGYEGIKRQLELSQKALPVRIKVMQYINTGPAFEAFFAIASQFLTEKIKSRLTVHGTSLVPFLKGRDLSRLPDEYLSDDYTGTRLGRMPQIMERFIESEIRNPKTLELVRRLRFGNYGINQEKKLPQEEVQQASYRKLHVS